MNESAREQPPGEGRRLGRGHALVFACALLWSLGGVFVKELRGTYDVDPRAIACLRALVAGLVLSWALGGLRGAPPWRTLASAPAYAMVVHSFVVATAWTSAANAVFLQYAYPLFVAIVAVGFMGERLGWRTAVALAVGMGGVATILVGSWSPTDQAGLLWGFTSSLAFAAFALLQRSMRSGSPIGLASFYNLVAAAIALPFAWKVLAMPLGAFAVVAAMGVFQLGLPYVLFIRGLRSIPATDAALITLFEPVLNPLWVWLWVGEKPAAATLVGGGLILVALVVRFMGLPAGEAQAPSTRNSREKAAEATSTERTLG